MGGGRGKEEGGRGGGRAGRRGDEEGGRGGGGEGGRGGGRGGVAGGGAGERELLLRVEYVEEETREWEKKKN